MAGVTHCPDCGATDGEVHAESCSRTKEFQEKLKASDANLPRPGFLAGSCPDCGAHRGTSHAIGCPTARKLQEDFNTEMKLRAELVSRSSLELTIPIPVEVEPYADDIRRFVHAMVYKLKVHHRKGRWEGKSMAEYLPLLEGEVQELNDAVDGGNLIEILTEAADCANMALIIASIATERGE